MRRRRAILLTLLLLTGLTAACGLWLRAQQRQYTLNRQLMAALVKEDDTQALALVEAGADPQTRYEATPVPSLIDCLASAMLHRSPPPANNSPTALMIACGAPWDTDYVTRQMQDSRSDNADLVQVMLRQGAKVNVADKHGCTPLMYSVSGKRRKTVGVLLASGAEVNVKTHDGCTPLMYSIYAPGIMQLLLEHGADVNAQDSRGCTALYWVVENFASPMHTVPYNRDIAKECVRQLLAHGADVHRATNLRSTPLSLVEGYRLTDFAVLFKQAGARK